MENAIKLSSPGTADFWEIEILYEDADLLALNKPARLLASPDRFDPALPSLMQLLHAAIAQNKPWVRARGLSYLVAAHRLDFETSGVMLLAKSKPALVQLANCFGSEKPLKRYVALVQGEPRADRFTIEAKLAPHPAQPHLERVDPKRGKRARTDFEVRERFKGWALLECKPLTGRRDQIRAHLRHARLPIAGDTLYGGRPLLLSRLKSDYRLKAGQTERPLIARVALHAEELTLPHPVSGTELRITAPWPKDFTVGVKYLRRYAVG